MPCKACHPPPVFKKPKVLYFDTENSAKIGAYYGKKWETSILWNIEDWRFLCFSYAWNDGPIYVNQSWNELTLVNQMWKLIDEADVLIAHNASFDLGHFYARCLYYKLGVPRLPKVVCTLKLYRKLCKGGFESNSLGDLGVELGLGKKKALEKGFWRKVMNKDRKSIEKMKIYAKQDINLLRKLYKVIEPFFPPLKFKAIK